MEQASIRIAPICRQRWPLLPSRSEADLLLAFRRLSSSDQQRLVRLAKDLGQAHGPLR